MAQIDFLHQKLLAEGASLTDETNAYDAVRQEISNLRVQVIHKAADYDTLTPEEKAAEDTVAAARFDPDTERTRAQEEVKAHQHARHTAEVNVRALRAAYAKLEAQLRNQTVQGGAPTKRQAPAPALEPEPAPPPPSELPFTAPQ